MREIKRYDFWESDNCMKAKECGEFVKYDDVQELIECDQIEQKLLESSSTLKFRITLRGEFVIDIFNNTVARGRIMNTRTKLEALRGAEEWAEGIGANDGR